MPIELSKISAGKAIRIRVSGKLQAKDYEKFVPHVEALISQYGKLRLLFEMEDFHGWSAGALWEDLKFDLSHFSDIERLALVGDKKWQKGMAIFCKPFTTAQVRYFESEEADKALSWIKEGLISKAMAGATES